MLATEYLEMPINILLVTLWSYGRTFFAKIALRRKLGALDGVCYALVAKTAEPMRRGRSLTLCGCHDILKWYFHVAHACFHMMMDKLNELMN
jgi:hypothetical protein